MHDASACNKDALMIGHEFARIHPDPDHGSMHLNLPAEEAQAVIDAGWGENHYLVTQGDLPVGPVIVFPPRDEGGLDVVKTVVGRSYAYAKEHSPEV